MINNFKGPLNQIYLKNRENVNAKLKKGWKAKKAAAIATAEVELNFKFPAQLSNQGIWHRNFHPNPSLSDKRNLVPANTYTYYIKSHP